MESNVVRAQEIMRRLECGPSKAYRIIKELNEELKAKGYITIAGRVPRKYFEQRCKIGSENEVSKC